MDTYFREIVNLTEPGEEPPANVPAVAPAADIEKPDHASLPADTRPAPGKGWLTCGNCGCLVANDHSLGRVHSRVCTGRPTPQRAAGIDEAADIIESERNRLAIGMAEKPEMLDLVKKMGMFEMLDNITATLHARAKWVRDNV